MDRAKESGFNLTNKSCMDKIFVYSGQNYGTNEADALRMLNDLSRTDRLTLSRRKMSSKRSKISMSTKNIEPKVNNQLFIKNFNHSALCCYLKLLEASDFWWNAYSLSASQRSSTNFRILNSKSDPSVDKKLHDEDFVAFYLNQMVKIHNQNTKKVTTSLNTKQSSNLSHGDISSDRHLYRSFRVLGLRKSSTSSKVNKNFHGQYNFNEIVDIRTTFNINHLNDFSGYEYSIECELSYYQLNLKECSKCKYRSSIDRVNVNSQMSGDKNDNNKKNSNSNPFQILEKEKFFKINV